MRAREHQTALLLVLAVIALLLTPPAAGAYPPWVLAIRDCRDNDRLDGTYRPRDLAEALRNFPSDGDEYTDCADVIRRALEGGSGKPAGQLSQGIVTASGAVAASN